ncbi:hypothetical protein VB834_00860 [Limnoraphis robusta Tam1]|jgi:hypothetical protein|uniref:Uncharacterized protein n=2 Tax=Limnoraphis robusta TaxID=1118279 RepID=A0ABU5TYS4_9CYAN|nr:hypothetical protein [Limnoraphis robusta]MEA5499161.1 hypothetical protein [Limnoraphis robusta BA-68 BA1]MEA5519852.1 hypothetical protein [Limnoraphis robusta CCNP1315]MEA5537574.1 hypothetical protein [Limnoraphis robusta Tam1]MEA5547887.1 hypothetical protein [Limnoraphis robusta CCNP1324]
MNTRLILFSGIMMALLGSVFGLAVSKLHQDRYQCCDYIIGSSEVGYSRSKAPSQYAMAGAAMGFAVGSVLETVRQMKPEENEE